MPRQYGQMCGLILLPPRCLEDRKGLTASGDQASDLDLLVAGEGFEPRDLWVMSKDGTVQRNPESVEVLRHRPPLLNSQSTSWQGLGIVVLCPF